jgi:hypothetical protein
MNLPWLGCQIREECEAELTPSARAEQLAIGHSAAELIAANLGRFSRLAALAGRAGRPA